MAVNTFADTSAVSVSYAFSDAYSREDLAGSSLAMNFIGFTSEGFSMSKESQQSEAITDSRRPLAPKNTKGSAEGQVTQEFGVTNVFKDMLSAALMNDWEDKTTFDQLTDGDIKKYMVFERTIRLETGAALKQKQEQYFGTLINEATLEIGDGDLMTFDISTMSANAEYVETEQGAGALGGSIACSKGALGDYEIADGSNNIDNLIVKDSNGNVVPMTFSSGTLTINNNGRIQDAIGHTFAAGVAVGMVNVSFSGEAYYADVTVFEAHMENKTLSLEFVIQTDDGRLEFYIPAVKVEAPDANAGGQNQDLMQSITLNAFGGEKFGEDCVILVRYYSDAAKIVSVAGVISDSDGTFTITTENIANGTAVALMVMDQCGNKIELSGNVTANEVKFTDESLSSLDGGTLTMYASSEGVKQKQGFVYFNKP